MLEQQLADTMSGGPKKRRGAQWPRAGEHRFFLISLFLSASRQKEKPVRLEDIKAINKFSIANRNSSIAYILISLC
jgi:hypothetical protein